MNQCSETSSKISLSTTRKAIFTPPGPPGGIFFWTIDNFFVLKIPVRDTHGCISDPARLSMHFWLLKVLQATKISIFGQKFYHGIGKIKEKSSKMVNVFNVF